MGLEVTKRFDFAAAHRLAGGYAGPCQNIHGHNYTVEVTVTADTLDKHDMLIDFKVLKDVVTPVLKQFDHKFIISYEDSDMTKQLEGIDTSITHINGQVTAENLALLLSNEIQNELNMYDKEMFADFMSRNVRVSKIKIYETEGNCVTWSR